MYPGFPKGLMRLSRRLVGPRALNRALRQVSDLMNGGLATPPRPAPAKPAPKSRPAPPQPGSAPGPARDATGVVSEVVGFGTNPGALRMLMYLPSTLPDTGAPLVVVLHGCGQNAAQFAAETGWLALADRLGLAVVMPEQVAANNAGRCFNWFRAEDIARDQGEAMSVREMVEAAVARAHLDTKRVYVVGLSAGGAMAAALLAAYPDLFAAGASVAGLPVGCASDVSSALARMSRGGHESPATLAARARATGPSYAPARWPRISIWQGDADRTVAPVNAEQLAAQFVALHGIADPPTELPEAAKLTGRAWAQRGGIAVEVRSVAGMGHGYPIADGTPADQFVLPLGIDATDAIAGFWGLRPRG